MNFIPGIKSLTYGLNTVYSRYTVARVFIFLFLLRVDGGQFVDITALVYINFYTRWWINCIYVHFTFFVWCGYFKLNVCTVTFLIIKTFMKSYTR